MSLETTLRQWLSSFAAQHGASAVLDRPSDMQPYLTDWRKRYHGTASAVLRPATTQAVCEIVEFCQTQGVAIAPQGGNTGLVGGATPVPVGIQPVVVLSTNRLKEVCAVDTQNRTLTVSAGYTLYEAQNAAQNAGQYFPLSLASEGTCTVGGNLASNAGGTAVLRYGNTRELCLGLQAVLPGLGLYDGLSGLRKNNTGYDLRHLLIGSEGTLGVITRATFRLYALPTAQVCAFVSVPGIAQGIELLNRLQSRFEAELTTFEWMASEGVERVQTHFGVGLPVRPAHSHCLIELSSQQSSDTLQHALETLLAQALADETVLDAALAQSGFQRDNFWALRENISEAQAREGLNIKHDISLPISCIPVFYEQAMTALHGLVPGCEPVVFGHLGDGNLHFNVSGPAGSDSRQFMDQWQTAVNACVHDLVHAHGGSISAEHGIGLLKRDLLPRYADPVGLAAMKAIKRALDPKGIMNPGKLLQTP